MFRNTNWIEFHIKWASIFKNSGEKGKQFIADLLPWFLFFLLFFFNWNWRQLWGFWNETEIKSLPSVLWSIYVLSVALTFLWSPNWDQIFKRWCVRFSNELETLSYTGILYKLHRDLLGGSTGLRTITSEEAEFSPLHMYTMTLLMDKTHNWFIRITHFFCTEHTSVDC